MNKNPISAIGGISLLAALIVAILLTAQEGLAQVSSKHHTRYKVIDTGTFGGPNGHMSLGAHILNNNGTFTGFADTSTPDPYAPDGCWDGDCLVAVLAGGPNNESNWMSANGLIAGDSQDGLLDPLTGGWEIRGVLWKDGNIIDLGTLECGYESLARGVNSAGEVAGLSTTLVPDPNAMIFYFGLPFPF